MSSPADSPADGVYARLAADYEARAQLVRDTVHELQTNPAYQPYFAGYTPESVRAFVEQYAQRKAKYVYEGPRQAEYFEVASTDVQERALACLWQIQQKKLFDLQCQWRAGLFRHPDLHVCEQFEYWGRHPERCPFLPPVAPDEVDLYLDYLAQPDCPEGDWSRYRRTPNWQDYFELRSVYYDDELPLVPADSHIYTEGDAVNGDELDAQNGRAAADLPANTGLDRSEEDDEDEEDEDDEEDDDWDLDEEDEDDDQPTYPAWYRFYDQRRGTGHLRHLRNVRGWQQQQCSSLALRHAWENPAPAPPAPAAEPAPAEIAATAPAATEDAPPPAPYVPDKRAPWYSYDEDALFRMMVEKFDPTPGLLELRRAQEQGLHDRDNEVAEAALLAYCNLADSTLVVPVEADWPDWRPALRQAELLLRRRQLALGLPVAYEDYRQRLDLGLVPATPRHGNSYDDETEEPWNVDYARERVLRGRELSGEPRDFDF